MSKSEEFANESLIFAELDSLLSVTVEEDGMDFLVAAYTIFDMTHAEIIEREVKSECSKGCCTCCDDSIYLTNLEFSHMLQGIGRLHQKQSYWMEKMIKKSMGEYRQTVRSALIGVKAFQGETNICPFLYMQECMIYEYRPHFCRTLHCINDGDDIVETVFDKWLQRVIRDHPENQNDYPTGVAPLGHFLCGHFDND